jgi:hypothetical protein
MEITIDTLIESLKVRIRERERERKSVTELYILSEFIITREA